MSCILRKSRATYWLLVGVPQNQDMADVIYPYIDHSPGSAAAVVDGAPRPVEARAVGRCCWGSRRPQGLPKTPSWSPARARAIPKSVATCALRCSSSAWRRRANCSEAWKALHATRYSARTPTGAVGTDRNSRTRSAASSSQSIVGLGSRRRATRVVGNL